MIKCPNCGSTAQVKLKEIYQADKYVQITWVCGCGTEQVTRMSYEDYVHYNFNMTPLAYQMIQAINKKVRKK